PPTPPSARCPGPPPTWTVPPWCRPPRRWTAIWRPRTPSPTPTPGRCWYWWAAWPWWCCCSARSAPTGVAAERTGTTRNAAQISAIRPGRRPSPATQEREGEGGQRAGAEGGRPDRSAHPAADRAGPDHRRCGRLDLGGQFVLRRGGRPGGGEQDDPVGDVAEHHQADDGTERRARGALQHRAQVDRGNE